MSYAPVAARTHHDVRYLGANDTTAYSASGSGDILAAGMKRGGRRQVRLAAKDAGCRRGDQGDAGASAPGNGGRFSTAGHGGGCSGSDEGRHL